MSVPAQPSSSGFLAAVGALRTALDAGSSSSSSAAAAAPTPAASQAVLRAIVEVSQKAKAASDAELSSNTAVAVLDEILNGTKIMLILNKALITAIGVMFSAVFTKSPGHIVRRYVGTQINILAQGGNNNASASGSGGFKGSYSPWAVRECAALLIGQALSLRPNDLGGSVTESVAALIKLTKASEQPLRLAGTRSLCLILERMGSRIADVLPELVKVFARLASDRAPDVRCEAAKLSSLIAAYSDGFSIVPVDAALGPALKGLLDDVASVQDRFAGAVGAVYSELLRSYLSEQEKLKVGAARGGSAEDGDGGKDGPSGSARGRAQQGGSSSLLKLKDLAGALSSGNQKKSPEEFDFRNIVKAMLAQVLKAPSSASKAAHLIAVQYFLRSVPLQSSTPYEDWEWAAAQIINLLRESTILSLAYEDIVYFRCRVSHLFRCGLSGQLSEGDQLKLVNYLSTTLSKDDSKGEHDLQFVLAELGQLVAVLGEPVGLCAENVHQATALHLKHSSFGVRAAASQVVASLAVVVPSLASVYLAESLSITMELSHLLLSTTDIGEVVSDGMHPADFGDVADAASIAPPSSSDVTSAHPQQQDFAGGRRKESSRLQLMFAFHGHVLVVSSFLKSERQISTGLPQKLITDCFDFGIQLLTLDVFNMSSSIRHIVCSIIRAGSLIVSSCLNVGYGLLKARVEKLLISCCDILVPMAPSEIDSSPGAENFSIATTPKSPNGGGASMSSQDLLYELMSAESALVCLSAMLWSCPDAFVLNTQYMEMAVQCLTAALYAVKGKYQSKFRSHFRFRTLHVIMLECFAWMPLGSFPSASQILYVEAMRTFRDSINSSFECTGLSNSILPDQRMLCSSGLFKFSQGVNFCEVPLTDNLFMLRLEQHSVALQKKESEAFLASFSKDAVDLSRASFYSNDWHEPSAPCAFIDSRTIDASISLIGATFPSQSPEFQNKLLELCSQILTQVQKASASVGMFTSEEEKRRRERYALLSTRSAAYLLNNIIESFPFADGADSLPWLQTIVDTLLDLACHYSPDIRAISANTLSKLCSKAVGTQLTESLSIRIVQLIKSLADKNKGDGIESCCGLMLVLAALCEVARDKHVLQAAMSTIIFDMLRNYDFSSQFRSYALLALASVVRSKAVGQGSNDVHDTLALIRRVCDIAETHLASPICSSGADGSLISSVDIDLLLVSIQRLVNACVSIVMEIDPSSSLMTRLFSLWTIVRNSSDHPYVVKECIEFVVAATIFHTESIDAETMTLFVQQVINMRSDTNLELLRAAVAAVRSLMMRHSSLICRMGVEVDLFQIYDWCCSSATPICGSVFWGIELHTGLTSVVDSVDVLQKGVELALDAIVGIEVQQRPEENAVHWVLFCRAVALGGRNRAAAGDASGPAAAANSGSGNPLTASNVRGLTYQQFTSIKRDFAAFKAVRISSVRCRLKCIALRCATAAFFGAGRQEANADLSLARKATQEACDKLVGNVPITKVLSDVPAYLPLFINDMVTFACACASYTIEDRPQVALQTEAVQLLQGIIERFGETIDPDVLGSNDGGGSKGDNKILCQYLAQMTSALRACLVVQSSFALAWTSGALLFELIRGSHLSDKTVVRRLIKTLVTNAGLENPENLLLRPAASNVVAEDVSIVSKIIHLTNLARIYMLTKKVSIGVDVEESIQTSILQTLDPYLKFLRRAWHAIAIDGARLMQGQKKWPKCTPETDPRRGGITYGSDIDCSRLQSHYDFALPFVAAACADAGVSEGQPLQPVLECILENIFVFPHNNFEHKFALRPRSGQSTITIRCSRAALEPLVLWGLYTVLRKRLEVAVKDGNILEIQDVNDVERLLIFITKDLLPSRLNLDKASEFVSLAAEIISTVSVCCILLAHQEKLGASNTAPSLWFWCWNTLMTVLHGFFPDLLRYSDPSGFNLSSHQFLRAKENGADMLRNVSFPSISPSPMLLPTPLFTKRADVLISSEIYRSLSQAFVSLSKLSFGAVATHFMLDFQAAFTTRIVFWGVYLTQGRFLYEKDIYETVSILVPNGTTNFSSLVETIESWILFCSTLPSDKTTILSAASSAIESVLAFYFHHNRAVLDEVEAPWKLFDSFVVNGNNDAIAEILRAIKSYLKRAISPEITFISRTLLLPAVIVIASSNLSFPLTTKVSFAELILRCVVGESNSSAKQESLRLLLPALCSMFISSSSNSNFVAIGIELTNLAKNNPDIFKAEVACLADASKLALQNTMKVALGNEVTSSRNEVNSNKKIDLSRYKK